MPVINLLNIFNSPALHSNPAFRKKLVILDFMASNCISCLKVLPRFDSIQKIYNEDVQIFLVTYEKKDRIKKFLQSHPSLHLPIIGEDSILTKYFPHTFISHEVWIREGVVIAITHPEYVIYKNIQSVLAGNKIDWPVKKDLPDFDYAKPLLAGNNNPLFYSALCGYLPNVPPRYLQSTDKKITRTLMVNMRVIDLYLHGYGREGFPIGHILLKVKDPSRYIYNGTGYREAWKKENTFCFEAFLPSGDMQQQLALSLDKYLGTKGRFDTVAVKGYILQKMDSVFLLSKKASQDIEKSSGIKSISVAELMYVLNDSWYGVPAIDATGCSKMYLNLTAECLGNISLLQRALEKYGLRLLPATLRTEMFLLEENYFIQKIKN